MFCGWADNNFQKIKSSKKSQSNENESLSLTPLSCIENPYDQTLYIPEWPSPPLYNAEHP